MKESLEDTIAAIATPIGEAAISVIRISGKSSIKIANKIFSGPVHKYKSHTVNYGKILAENNKKIDSVILLIMKAPKSYTGEDSIEIQCHGGVLITKKILNEILKKGARLAAPGEFTLRAFLNKKMDKISNFQKELIDIASNIEAILDFAEEDLDLIPKSKIKKEMKNLIKEMELLKNSFNDGKLLFKGINLAIIGTPNVGKSSLMNALMEKEKAIVTNIKGTTRDILEEKIILGSLHFNLIDTAGIGISKNRIEKEGIKRSKKTLQSADFILLVLDSSRKLSKEDFSLLEKTSFKKRLILWNKIDLNQKPPKIPYKNILYISAKKNIGITNLKKEIEKIVWKKGPPSNEEIILTKERHRNALKNSIDFLKKALKEINENSFLEIVASNVKDSLKNLKKIIGHDIEEDILSAIFSKFCIGK
jgi:tRNA modification GTPase